MKELNGFINIDKPENWTSHDVVSKLRKILGKSKIGHAGTLDPFATGVLPIAIGPSTRLINFLPKSKQYLAQVDLRFTTDTDDLTGIELKTSKEISIEEIRSKLNSMQGDFLQYPPLYSAKKINGKKLYELMREGKSMDLSEIKPKLVKIKDIKILNFEYPYLTLDVSCGEGTYIRSIARDIGGHLRMLRRLESNGLRIESSIRFDDLEDIKPEDLILQSKVFLDLPSFKLDRDQIKKFQEGQSIHCDLQVESEFVMCLDGDQELLGIANLQQGSKLLPKVVF